MFFVEQTVSRSDWLSVTHSIGISLCSQRSNSVSKDRIQRHLSAASSKARHSAANVFFTTGISYEIANEWEKLFHHDCTKEQ